MSSIFQNYGLYGTEQMTVSPDFVHLVSIDSSCRKYNWVIKPHFHSRLYQFFVIESGSGTFIFNEKSRPFSGPNLIIMPENTLHGFQFSQDIVGYTLSVSSDIIDRIGEQDRDLLLAVNRVRLLHLGNQADEFDYLMVSIRSMARELDNQAEKVHLFLESMVRLLLVKIFRLKTETAKEYVGTHRELAYYNEFMRLLKQALPTNRCLAYYTRAVGISKTHLNRVCQTIAGESTRQVISRYLTNEAMILLTYSELTISEIAHQLEFSEVSYFCRFFKKQVGTSPACFRTQAGHRVVLNY